MLSISDLSRRIDDLERQLDATIEDLHDRLTRLESALLPWNDDEESHANRPSATSAE